MPHPITEIIRSGLREAGNEEFAVNMQAYMKSSLPFHGVKSKEQAAISKPLFREHPIREFDEYKTVIEELWSSEYREEKYAAIACARHHKKLITLDAIPIYEMMIREGAWWDYVDVIAVHLVGPVLLSSPEHMVPLLRLWIDDENMWIRRTAILAQLMFKEKMDTGLLFEFCDKRLHEDEFFIRKAIGWVLRQHSKTDPDVIRAYVDSRRDKMSGLTLREASKYTHNV